MSRFSFEMWYSFFPDDEIRWFSEQSNTLDPRWLVLLLRNALDPFTEINQKFFSNLTIQWHIQMTNIVAYLDVMLGPNCHAQGANSWTQVQRTDVHSWVRCQTAIQASKLFCNSLRSTSGPLVDKCLSMELSSGQRWTTGSTQQVWKVGMHVQHNFWGLSKTQQLTPWADTAFISFF